MQIGQIIRKYRKQKDMTQEEMANRLGVTAPAVNKWENGNSYPDITLLAPLARLLDISLDTLLSFREELTTEEIQDIVYTVNSMLREKSFEEAFEWAKEKIQQYPNCEVMILEVAVLLNAAHMRTENDGVECDRSNDGQQDSEDSGADRSNRRQERQNATENISEEQGTRQQDQEYDQYITRWFSDSLKSEREQIRTMAADALFAFYLSKKQYDKAEKCLEYYSEQNPERGANRRLYTAGQGGRRRHTGLTKNFFLPRIRGQVYCSMAFICWQHRIRIWIRLVLCWRNRAHLPLFLRWDDIIRFRAGWNWRL